MKILIPLDGSEHALEAVRFAIRMVEDGIQASFVLANVQEPTYLYELVLAPDAGVLERVTGGAGAHAIEAGEDLARQAELVFEREIATGDAAHTLIDIIERYACDAVIMGARGMGTLRSALLGSVSHELLYASPVPVMIIKPPQQPPANEEDAGE